MTNRERTAFALGYLRGVSLVMWSLDRENSPVQVGCDDAAYFDEQVDVLVRAFGLEGAGEE